MPSKNPKPAHERAEPPVALPDIMTITPKELFQRLEWVEVEIAQLSSQNGVSERLHALRYTRAHLETIRLLRLVMDRAKGDSGQAPK